MDTKALAQFLAAQMASKLFSTREGKKTGAELAREIAEGKRMDFRADDGSLEGKIRGEKSIVQGSARKVQEALEVQKERTLTTGQGGGGLASKGNDLSSLPTTSLPQDLVAILPQLRALGEEGIVEVLERWIQAPPQARTRGGMEYRLLKGFAHLSALKAQRSFDEVRDGDETRDRSGERRDFTVGHDLRAPLHAVKTLVRMTAAGGIYDDRVEVREIRITTDAPDLIFVVDSSGSMAAGRRMLAAMAAASATAEYYGQRGATVGLIILTGKDPIMMVRPPEPDVDKVIDGVLALEPTFGTAYAPAIELAFRAGQPRTTVMVIGDFEDSGLLSTEACALKSSKEIKTVALLAESDAAEYAAEMCDEVHLVDINDPTQVALVALKAAQ